jgi:hypothetical protein
VLQELGDLAGAKANFERAIAITEASLGPDHPNVAIFRRNLDLSSMSLVSEREPEA